MNDQIIQIIIICTISIFAAGITAYIWVGLLEEYQQVKKNDNK